MKTASAESALTAALSLYADLIDIYPPQHPARGEVLHAIAHLNALDAYLKTATAHLTATPEQPQFHKTETAPPIPSLPVSTMNHGGVPTTLSAATPPHLPGPSPSPARETTSPAVGAFAPGNHMRIRSAERPTPPRLSGSPARESCQPQTPSTDGSFERALAALCQTTISPPPGTRFSELLLHTAGAPPTPSALPATGFSNSPVHSRPHSSSDARPCPHSVRPFWGNQAIS